MYTCKAIISDPCEDDCKKVSQVKGTHAYGLTNKDVQAFIMENQSVTRFIDVSFFFPNILYLNLAKNSLTEVTRADLESYPNLDTLRLSGNKIERISEDIFKGLPLNHIEMDSNSIEYVLHTLTFPTSLNYLNLKDNPCINMVAKSEEMLDELKDKLLLSCSHSPRIEHLEIDVGNIKQHESESDGRIAKLENIIKGLKEAMKIKSY